MEDTRDARGSARLARHTCQFAGCDKTFIRKEHLTRHERSHAPHRSFICYICDRGFNRNDILQRHIVRHNSSAIANARSGRACDGCHSSKIKCEGGQPCSPCIKRRVECKSERDEEHVASIIPSTSGLHVDWMKAPDLFMASLDRRDIEREEPMGDTTRHTARHAQEDVQNLDSLSSSSYEKPFPFSMRAWGYPPGMTYVRSVPNTVTKEHYELYVDNFHHRWPIIHVPSFEKGDDPYVLSASVEMIGAWLQGSCQSKIVALTLHDRLTKHIFQRMYEKPSYVERYRPWQMHFYQATLLNIIFGFYCGKEDIVSRVVLLCSMLISSLRDLGFFRSDIAALQEKGATFYPYITTRQEERKRLATALFRIDCYLSIIRGKPMTLRCEELYFSLPSTFSLFNGPGLHMWEARAADEPVHRSQETMSSMISDRSFSSIAQPFILVEDIQLGMCASQADIWQYSGNIQSSFEHDISSLIRQKSLRDALDSWKRLFDQTSIEGYDSAMQGKTNLIPIKYYYGVEDHSKAGWQELVSNRPQSLLFDTTMLYHLFELHIHADVRSFETLASFRKDCRITTGRDGVLEKEHRARQWTDVMCSRQAVWHASNIIAVHRSRYDCFTAPDKAVIGSLDPIAHVAVAVGSLVIWAYCCFNKQGCAQCIGPGISPVVELMDSVAKNEESDNWIELGGRATLDGHNLCRCNVERVVGLFRQCLPSANQKWDLADSLSGVLNETI